MVEALTKLEGEAQANSLVVDDEEIDIDAILAGVPTGTTASVGELLALQAN